mgnify:CR=1 FL=1
MSKSWLLILFSANESNPEGELAVNILVGNIIEIATAHANMLGIGNPAMAHLGAGWVLSRLTIEMTRYPKCNTSYVLKTWVAMSLYLKVYSASGTFAFNALGLALLSEVR